LELTIPDREFTEFEEGDFDALRGRVREDFWLRNKPVMDQCRGMTIKEDGLVLACWGWVLESIWVAIADDLNLGQLRFCLDVGDEWLDTWDWSFKLVYVREDDNTAIRFVEHMGFTEFDRPKPGAIRYERIKK